MPELVRVQLTEGKRNNKGHEAVSSTFHFENKRYFLLNGQSMAVERGVASAWKAADSNVMIVPDK